MLFMKAKHGLLEAKQDCWFSMISYVPCMHYKREDDEWKYVNDLDMVPSNLFSMDYQGYWQS